MYCEACKSLLTSPLFDNCPKCGYPFQIGLETRVEYHVAALITPSIWQALSSPAKLALLQAEREYHTVWLTETRNYDLEIIRRLYAQTIALQFENDVIVPFKQKCASELNNKTLQEDITNNRVYWFAKYIRKSLDSRAYVLSIQQLYLLLTYLGGNNVRTESFLINLLHEFILFSKVYCNPSRLWSRTKRLGECKFRKWISELALFEKGSPKCYSMTAPPLRSLQQLHNYRNLFYTLENENGLPLLLNVTQGISLQIQSVTKELHLVKKEQILSDYQSYKTAQSERTERYRGMPSPIIVTHQAIEKAETNYSKFVCALRCAESIAAYCAVIAVAERLYSDSTPPFSDRQEIKKFFTDRHTAFGSWIALLQNSVDKLIAKNVNMLVPELVEFTRSQAIGDLKQLKKLRDLEEAHAMPYSESVFAGKLEEVVPLVDRLFHLITFLKKYPLVMVRKTENLEATNRYSLLKFTDSAADFKTETRDFSVNLRLSQYTLYLLQPKQETALSLTPFLTYEPCSTCDLEELFFLDVIDQANDRATYRSLTTNHRETTSKYMELFSPK